MNRFTLALLLPSLGLFCPGCQQEPQKEGASGPKPVTSAPANKADKVPAVAPQTEAKKAEVTTTGSKKPDASPVKLDDLPEVQRLIANLNDKDWLVRRDAASALGKLGDKQAVEPLIVCLKDADNSVRFNATEGLGKLGDQRAVEPLIACLKDWPLQRACAAESLGNLGDQRAVEPLIACLKDREIDRSCAASALGKLGDKRAVEPLIACLKDEDERVRRQAAEVLGRFGDQRAVAPLIAALPDWSVKDVIGAALKQLGGKPATDQERFYCRVAAQDDKGLLEEWSQTRQLILDDAGSHDLRRVQNAVYTVVALGKEDLVDDLVKLLNAHEEKEIAEVYLNCHHEGLTKAAETWATQRGYSMTSGKRGAGPAWGRW